MEDRIHALVREKLLVATGRVFIRADYVSAIGYAKLRMALEDAGVLGEATSPQDGTLCARCGETRGAHKEAACTFAPLRYVSLASEAGKTTYNAAENSQGHLIRYLIETEKRGA